MGIAANTQCFYVDGNNRVINVTTLSSEERDGTIQIKHTPDWRPRTVHAIDVFMTEGAASRAAMARAAKRSGRPPAPATFVR